MEDDAPPGVPEWVVTYGDMMSLLLTFFIMLVSLSEVQANKKYRAVLEALQRHMGYRTSPISPPGKNFPLNAMVVKLKKLGSHADDGGRGGTRVNAAAGDELHVHRNYEGDAVASGEPIPFVAGTEEFGADADVRLHEIVQDVSGLPNKIEIRGHCGPRTLVDGSPMPYDEMLELCFRRARRVRRVLVDAGVDENLIRVVAVADAEQPQRVGDALMHLSDRVEVKLLNVHSENFIGPR